MINFHQWIALCLIGICSLRRISQASSISASSIALWSGETDQGTAPVQLRLVIQLSSGDMMSAQTWPGGRGILLLPNPYPKCAFSFASYRVQSGPLTTNCQDANPGHVEFVFSADFQSVEIKYRLRSQVRQFRFLKRTIHNPGSLVGDWVSKEANSACTVSIGPYKNPYSDDLQDVLQMNAIDGSLDLSIYDAVPVTHQSIGVSFDRMSGRILLVFADVRSYWFEARVDERKGTIVGTWSPPFGCGTTFLHASAKK